MRPTRVLSVVASATLALGLASVPADSATPDPGSQVADERARGPRLTVRVVKAGLDHPWDLTFLPNRGMLYTQRDRETIRYRGPRGVDRPVRIKNRGIWHADESGLMSILATRNFGKSRQFLTCHANANSSRPAGMTCGSSCGTWLPATPGRPGYARSSRACP